jgi:CRP-like cAMP-binding protein
MSWTAAVPALSGLAPESARRLDALAPMDVPAGTVLFRPGDAVKGYVIVLDGRIGVHLVGPTGRDILLYDVVPGKSCIQSTLGLLGGEDYTAEALADRPTRLVLLPRATFLDLLGRDPAFRGLVFAAFAERMQSMMPGSSPAPKAAWSPPRKRTSRAASAARARSSPAGSTRWPGRARSPSPAAGSRSSTPGSCTASRTNPLCDEVTDERRATP